MNQWISSVHKAALAVRSIPIILRYAMTTTLVVGTVWALRSSGAEGGETYTYLPFIGVVFVCATLFDRGNGFFATLLSAAVCSYFILYPHGTLSVPRGADETATVLFVAIGFAISFVTEALHNGLVALATERENTKLTLRDRDVLLNELAHRTRNDFANVVTLLNLQARSANAEAREALTSAAERVQTIARVHRRLELREDRVVVDTKSYIGELCSDLRLSRLGMRPIALDWDAESHSISLEKAVPLGLIINESVTNATKHGFPDQRQGIISVTFRRDGDVYRLVIADNGVGNGDASAPGIGNRLMGMLAAQLNSTLTFDARSPGLAVVVTIPITKVI